jgi:hypothetical protein
MAGLVPAIPLGSHGANLSEVAGTGPVTT